jgi:hypothetical protein
MKMGNIVSPWRYEAYCALDPKKPRLFAVSRYPLWPAISDVAIIRLSLMTGVPIHS